MVHQPKASEGPITSPPNQGSGAIPAPSLRRMRLLVAELETWFHLTGGDEGSPAGCAYMNGEVTALGAERKDGCDAFDDLANLIKRFREAVR